MNNRNHAFKAGLTIAALCTLFASGANGQTFIFSTDADDYVTTPVFSDVQSFSFSVWVDAPLEAGGTYVDPVIISVDYQVTGTLAAGTPSGFPMFALQRSITGEEFYAQGSSLSFSISPAAVLDDGVQVAELVGPLAFTFNGREVDTGRFHPALFELNSDGTGRIQNSNNVPTLNPLLEVEFGEEYITDLLFDPGNTTLLQVKKTSFGGGSSGCFVATAAYGSYLHPEVLVLRRFRDQYLLTNVPGRSFVDWYYRTSPPLAAYIAEHNWLRVISRVALTPMVYSVKYPFLFTGVIALLVLAAVRRRILKTA